MSTAKDLDRDADQGTMKILRDADRHDLTGYLGIAGNEIREDICNAGDTVRRDVGNAGDSVREGGDRAEPDLHGHTDRPLDENRQ